MHRQGANHLHSPLFTCLSRVSFCHVLPFLPSLPPSYFPPSSLCLFPHVHTLCLPFFSSFKLSNNYSLHCFMLFLPGFYFLRTFLVFVWFYYYFFSGILNMIFLCVYVHQSSLSNYLSVYVCISLYGWIFIDIICAFLYVSLPVCLYACMCTIVYLFLY